MSNYKFRSEENDMPITVEEVKAEVEEKAPIILDKKTTTKVNIRKRPSLKAQVVRIENAGAPIRVKEIRSDGWSELEDGNFIMTQYTK